MAELGLQQRNEFCLGQFAHMEGIGWCAGRRVDVAIRRTDEAAAGWAQHAADLADEIRLPVEMLDGFERNHDIDAGIGQRQRARVTLQEVKFGSREVSHGGSHGGAGVIDGDHPSCDLGEQGRAIAFTACHVEHIQTLNARAGKQVSMVMLDLHLTANVGSQPLSGERFGMLRRFAAKDALFYSRLFSQLCHA
ncbi:MAG TPA: hypothetical protein VFL55_15390 [Acetobacteraceae bacterium]|nr:hypothetical protein [Acetobacteraceae bacterium]